MTRTVNFFDTLLFSQAMREAGMNEKTANALAEELKKFREESVIITQDEVSSKRAIVTNDIDTLRNEMHQEFKLVRNEMSQEFKAVRTDLGKDIEITEQRLLKEIKSSMLATIITIGSIVAFGVGVIIAVLKT